MQRQLKGSFSHEWLGCSYVFTGVARGGSTDLGSVTFVKGGYDDGCCNSCSA